MHQETRTMTVEEPAVAGLRARMRGQMMLPGDEGYGEARKVYNAAIDKRPALIARVADAADVVSAVDFARENELLLAVRGGGHSGAGLGTNDGGVVIDLAGMNGVSVDPEARTSRVGTGLGALWGRVSGTFGTLRTIS